MAKVKNKAKRNLADRVKAKPKKSTNPFEVHVNRQKFSVIGRKLKHDQGLPGIARSKAFKKRKATLLHEYHIKNKNNKFMDRRIGERNRFMSEEEKLTARFAAERMKAHKKSIYNLADEEILTHRGHALSEIEKFDDPRSDEDEDESGKLEAKFVKEAHFGGLLTKKEETESQAKSRKELIDQLIAESKKRRYEKQKMQDETLELTDKLDTQWKDLLPLVSLGKSEVEALNKAKNESTPQERVKIDPYDRAVQELKFEARGKPSEKLKTEEEIAIEEKERLEKLEAERQRRMHGFVDDVPGNFKYRSADDLDDGLRIESDIEEDDQTEDIGKDENFKEADGGESEEDAESEEGGSGDESDEDSLSDLVLESEDEKEEVRIKTKESIKDSNDEEKISSKNLKLITKESEEEETRPAAKRKLQEVSEATSKKGMEIPKKANAKDEKIALEDIPSGDENSTINKVKKELKEGSKESVSNGEDPSWPAKKKKYFSAKNEFASLEEEELEKKQLSSHYDTCKKDDDCNSFETSEKIRAELLRRKSIMEQARKELPYTFEVPDTSDGLADIMKGLSPDHQAVVLERMIKCTHPSLKSGNKERLESLFGLLVQHLHDCAWASDSQRSPAGQPKMSLPSYCFSVLESIVPYMYDLAQMSPENAAYCISELIYFKLIPQLFPTSDFRHPVSTPAVTFMSIILASCKIKTRKDIASGLFICTVMLECTSLSKRFSPEVINYLFGILHMAVPKAEGLPIPPHPRHPFKSDPIESNQLVVFRNPFRDLKETSELKLETYDLDEGKKKIDESFKVRAIAVACKLVLLYIDQLKDLLSRKNIFQPFLRLITLLPLDEYPEPLLDTIKSLQNTLDELMKDESPLEKLAHAAKKPKALKLYEPAVEEVFDGRKRKSMSREKMEREKLLHKYKKEMKGAIREIRRDKDFLAKVKVKETIRNDMERMEKVKEIFGSAATQLGEIRKMKRKA
ncbi:hypothetical protein J437_LFUL003396 [Ladona fulva]|uniref:Nucleolar protein 14 n=1 Tax=Ladona fulva TaxID=123851 RepID=A0A8K0K4K9_LADFU|nr:hypothetical protein J437_LFUL003396 [Ladona fulva]